MNPDHPHAPPAPGTRHTPIFADSPRTYPVGTFSMTDEERAQHEKNQRDRSGHDETRTAADAVGVLRSELSDGLNGRFPDLTATGEAAVTVQRAIASNDPEVVRAVAAILLNTLEGAIESATY